MTREEIDQKYIKQAGDLEGEFFNITDEGLKSQHRVLKEGKDLSEFNQKHREIWHNHEAVLITANYMKPRIASPTGRNIAQELDELKDKLRISGIEV